MTENNLIVLIPWIIFVVCLLALLISLLRRR
jgi:hypothetical protein